MWLFRYIMFDFVVPLFVGPGTSVRFHVHLYHGSRPPVSWFTSTCIMVNAALHMGICVRTYGSMRTYIWVYAYVHMRTCTRTQWRIWDLGKNGPRGRAILVSN